MARTDILFLTVFLVVLASAQLSKYANYEDLVITSNVSLGLIQVGWLTSNALKNESGFWNTCKPYLVRLYDGIYQNITNACALIDNPPAGLPQCKDNMTNFLLRSGSGYCLKSKVCGASKTIDFYKSADGSSLLWTWLNSVGKSLLSQGFTKTGTCYGYEKKLNENRLPDNMFNEDEKGVY
ncbi:hypothetical protein CAEBREN_29990 [Caenorhabditis brenneri]|uniref:Uncharacterized protein n=1 Tax=Caenorhabditis brenneri TaxID=135651 RepID=G0N4U7_CAEBE|nr:hypothetical protein CAEBREN_29990 [Caenorhabditis brenneri]